jgi:predicted GNAT family acetyltransferase
MNYLKLTKENLESEHICCAISSNKDPQVIAKKKWLEKQLDEGLVFLKADQRGKCFIEYLPAEKAFVPIEAKDYLYIDCFWVSGSLAGHGYGDELLEQCISEGKKKGKSGPLCYFFSEETGLLIRSRLS